MIRAARIYLARRKLEKLVKARRESFEVRDFVRRREAMLKFTRRNRQQRG